MKKWLPTIVTVAVTVVGAMSPAIRAAIAQSPELSLIIGGVYSIVKGLLPSPVA